MQQCLQLEKIMKTAIYANIKQKHHAILHGVFVQPAAIYARVICSLSGRILCESSLARLLPSPAACH